jgi:hypothetical protein
MAIAGVMMLGGSVTFGASDGTAPASTPPASKLTSADDVKKLKEDIKSNLEEAYNTCFYAVNNSPERSGTNVLEAINKCKEKYNKLLTMEDDLKAEDNSSKNQKAEDNSSKNLKDKHEVGLGHMGNAYQNEMQIFFAELSKEAKDTIEEYTQYVVKNAEEYSDCVALVYYLMMRGAQERLKDVDLTKWINTFKSKLMLRDNPSKKLQIQAVVMALIWPQVIAKLYNYSEITYEKAIYISDKISNNIYCTVDSAFKSLSDFSTDLINARMDKIEKELDKKISIRSGNNSSGFTNKDITGLSDSFYNIFMGQKSEDVDNDKRGRAQFMLLVVRNQFDH